MKKKPDYVDKITFQGKESLVDAMKYLYKYLYKDNVESDIRWKMYRRFSSFQVIKLSYAYKISPKLIGYKNYIKEIGKRINDILETAGIEYKKADFIPSSNLYDYPSRCYGRPHIHVYTEKDMLLLDFFKDNIVVLRNTEGEEIQFKLYGTYYNDNFKVKKITEVNEEHIDEDTTYKSFKNENENIYKLSNDSSKLEIGVGKREIIDEVNLSKKIKNISLNDNNIEYILKKLNENISLQKDANTYLSIKKYKKSRCTDNLTIKKGDIKIEKSINDNIKYEAQQSIDGNLHRLHYYDTEKKESINFYQFSNGDHKIESFGIKDYNDSINMCKKVSDDINNQYQKILSYMKK